MRCHNTTDGAPCPFGQTLICEDNSCAALTGEHIASVVLSALALSHSTFWCKKEFICCGICPAVKPPSVRFIGTIEAMLEVLVHLFGALAMVMILLMSLLPRTAETHSSYQHRTELWLGLCLARWVLGAILGAHEYLKGRATVAPDGGA